MEEERFTIYDEQGLKLGEDTRANAHLHGLWHTVVHVWLYDPSNCILYLQRRSLQKKDYAGLYDITTAGHVDAFERVEDAAIRECYEEIGIPLKAEQLEYLGSMKEAVFQDPFIDKEIAHVFLYACSNPYFSLGEEVESMVQVKVSDFLKFASDKRIPLPITSLDGVETTLRATQLCQHASFYYEWILSYMKERESF